MDWEFSLIFGPLAAIGTFVLFSLTPTWIIHLNHKLKSQEFRVTINIASETVEFQINENQNYKFGFGQLTVVEYLTLYQQNKNRLSTAWSNYSFLQIKTFDNKEFRISSLILTRNEFPIVPIQTKFALWPSITNIYLDLQPEIERTIKRSDDQVNYWKRKFSDLTIDQLRSRLERGDEFDKLPRTAMEELVKEKATNNS